MVDSTTAVEVKCPYVLRDLMPTDLEKLTPVQRSAHFNEITPKGELRLKRHHRYYWQVMTQMFCTGAKQTHFVTWTTQGISVEVIHYDDIVYSAALSKIQENYVRIFVPERYEMRQPRGLSPFRV